MKRCFKRAVSAVVSAVMCMTVTVPVHAGVEAPAYESEPVQESSIIDLGDERAVNYMELLDPADNIGSFYDTLTDSEKLIYETIARTLEDDNTDRSEDIIIFFSEDDLNAVVNAAVAFNRDNVKYFWIEGANVRKINGVPAAEIYLNSKYEGKIESMYSEFKSRLDTFLAGAQSCKNDYEKLKYAAQYICDNVEYDREAYNSGKTTYSSDAYSALVRGMSVCSGYANGFKVLCDELNIPCVRLSSYNHEWDAVYLDGAWYYIDTTWMDGGSEGFYDYFWFLCGTDTASAKDKDDSHVVEWDERNLLYSTSQTVSKTDYETPDKTIEINEDNFPDPYFRAYVQEVTDKNEDGYLTFTERNSQHYIYIFPTEDEPVYDMTGIGYYENLIGVIISGDGNKIKFLDISKNTYLKSLKFEGNMSEVTIDINDPVYDLSDLGSGFEGVRASDWSGASYDAERNSLKDFTSDIVTYTYTYANGLTADYAIKINYTGKKIIDGDINNDGNFDIDDVIDLARSILTTTDPSKNPYLPDGDRDGSGKIDIDDVILLARELIM